MGNRADFQSPFFQDRLAEWESFEIVRLLKDCWESLINHKAESAIEETEESIRLELKEEYNAIDVKFDRANKLISFEFEMEEIIL